MNDLSFDPSFSPQGVLYGTDGNSLFTINLSTGQPSTHTHITGHDFDGDEFLIGLAFAPSGTLFAWSLNNTSSGIFTISEDDGVATVIRANTPQTIFGMTFGLNGTMYASDGSHLMRLDPVIGNLLQTIGTFPHFITSLGYGQDSVLRGISPHVSTHGSDLYSISLSNASTTFLGSSVEDIYGIASIPAPAAFALFAAGGCPPAAAGDGRHREARRFDCAQARFCPERSQSRDLLHRVHPALDPFERALEQVLVHDHAEVG